MADGPAGAPCGTCGIYPHVYGCRPGHCMHPDAIEKIQNEIGIEPAWKPSANPIAPTPRLINESNAAYKERQRAEAASPTLAAINRASMVPEPAPVIESRPEIAAESFTLRLEDGLPIVSFAGVPLADFCANDQARIKRMASEGKVGIAGMCASCTAKVHAASPVDEPPAAEHPPPWRWQGPGGYESLVDAKGSELLWGGDPPGDINFASPRVRALTELAPNLERLREIEWSGVDGYDANAQECCPVKTCSAYEGQRHDPGCWLGNTIAAMDAAAKGGE